MSLKITVKVTGEQAVMRKLTRLNGLNDMHSAMTEIGQKAIKYYAGTGFTDRGRPWNQEWRDYSLQYKVWKEKHYPGRPMLEITGDMREGFFATVTNQSVTIDNKTDYYKYHQSAAERHQLPRRQMAGINGEIKAIVKSAIQADIKRKLAS